MPGLPGRPGLSGIGAGNVTGRSGLPGRLSPPGLLSGLFPGRLSGRLSDGRPPGGCAHDGDSAGSNRRALMIARRFMPSPVSSSHGVQSPRACANGQSQRLAFRDVNTGDDDIRARNPKRGFALCLHGGVRAEKCPCNPGSGCPVSRLCGGNFAGDFPPQIRSHRRRVGAAGRCSVNGAH